MNNSLGIDIPASRMIPIWIVFVVYTALVLGMGFYANRKNKKASAGEKASSFVTGGALGPIAIGMIYMTNNVASGTFIGGPGTSYTVGFIWTICVFAFFYTGMYVQGTVLKKMVIVKNRIHATSVNVFWRHRYQSKLLTSLMSLGGIIFSITYAIGQFAGGGKLFAVLTGTNVYIGLAVFGVVTLIYTACGGMKSLGIVSVFQGVLICVAVIMLYFGTRGKMVDQYGSFETAMRSILDTKPQMLLATTYPVLLVIQLSMQMGIVGLGGNGGALFGLQTRKATDIPKSALVTMFAATITCLCVSGIGPLAYTIAPALTSGDFVNPYLTVTVLPSVLGGVLVSATTAAIQSTVAVILITIASTFAKDFLKDVLNPKMEDKTLLNITVVTTVVATVIMAGLSMVNNLGLVQRFILLSSGGNMATAYMLTLLGAHWRRATTKGAIASYIGGYIGYVILTLWQNLAGASYRAVFGNFPNVILSMSVSFILFVTISLLTPPVPKGVLQVWFSPDYDEKYTKIN
jgi:sodium/pantothenate symporter